MRVQPRQRIVADRAQSDNFFSRLQRHRIVDFNGSYFRVARQIMGSAVMYFVSLCSLLPFARGTLDCLL
jgi:hypothetical protein